MAISSCYEEDFIPAPPVGEIFTAAALDYSALDRAVVTRGHNSARKLDAILAGKGIEEQGRAASIALMSEFGSRVGGGGLDSVIKALGGPTVREALAIGSPYAEEIKRRVYAARGTPSSFRPGMKPSTQNVPGWGELNFN